MSLIQAENWDGVTAPTLPSGWTVTANLATSTTIASSSPNSLALNNGAPASTWYFGTWGTADANNGNVIVSALVYFGSAATGSRWGVCARGSSSNLDASSTTQYAAYLQTSTIRFGPKAKIVVLASGVETTLDTAVVDPNFAASTWYRLIFRLNATSLQFDVQRVSDGYWLDGPNGIFSSTYKSAAIASDSTITGSGYAGLAAMQGGSSRSLYSDDWEFDNIDPPTWQPTYRLLPVYRPSNILYWT